MSLLGMDPAVLLDLANQVTKLQMFPYFDAAQAAITCLAIRGDLGADGIRFSRRHPLACWISCMVAVFSGGIVSAILLGEPLIGGFKRPHELIVATAVWYVIFYMPYDFGYKLASFLPVHLVLATMREVLRCKKVHDGVVHAASIYPDSFLIMLMVGTVRGNGSGFMRLLERLMRGEWTPGAVEILKPSFVTKLSFISALLFIAQKHTSFISAPTAIVYLCVTVFMIYFKVSALVLGIKDPLSALEDVGCMLFFGGMWDSMQRSLSGPTSSGVKADDSKARKKKD